MTTSHTTLAGYRSNHSSPDVQRALDDSPGDSVTRSRTSLTQ
jgi:hypothetical protein